MILAGTIYLLCAWGIYASAVMARKSLRAARGGLSEASVVDSERARAIGGLPNSFFGLAYYLALALCVPFAGLPLVWTGAFIAVVAAAVFSIYLAYSLLFVTKMPCPFCWSSHAVNWSLVALWFLMRTP